MDKEIKEILEETKRQVDYSNYKEHYHLNDYFEVEHIAKLLDYITNLQEKYQNAINQSIIDHKYASKKEDEAITLQEENKKLKKSLTDLSVKCGGIIKRNASAIEYIKNDLTLTDGFMIYEDGAKELLNILQGEDKDE